MRFVKLTTLKNGEAYIDISKAISLWRDLENHHTVLCFSDDNVLEVKETPEEILIKLPVIGG